MASAKNVSIEKRRKMEGGGRNVLREAGLRKKLGARLSEEKKRSKPRETMPGLRSESERVTRGGSLKERILVYSIITNKKRKR